MRARPIRKEASATATSAWGRRQPLRRRNLALGLFAIVVGDGHAAPPEHLDEPPQVGAQELSGLTKAQGLRGEQADGERRPRLLGELLALVAGSA
jgi:hypothetical protein